MLIAPFDRSSKESKSLILPHVFDNVVVVVVEEEEEEGEEEEEAKEEEYDLKSYSSMVKTISAWRCFIVRKLM